MKRQNINTILNNPVALVVKFHATAPKSHFLSPLRWLKRGHIRSQWMAEGTSCNGISGAIYFGRSNYPRAFVCVAWRTRKWSCVRLHLGLAPAGRRIFRHWPDFKKDELASTLHEITATNWGLKQVHHTLQLVRRKVESKRAQQGLKQQ
jgi:hypothetical protein